MHLNDAIKNRKSTKKFSHRKPDWRDIIECVEAARHAPLAGGIPTLKFILVSGKEKINMIAEACQQDFVSDVRYIVAVASNPSLVKKSFGERGEIYARQQAGAAIQNFLLSIEEKKMAACWIGHFNENQIKRELKIPDNANLEAVIPVGYEFKKEKPSKKPSMDFTLNFEKYGNKKMKGIKKLDV
ncbi:nitroreductase family protein [Candidatus Pacearchaeota archaeon]|nr:nitroreductase family protein [Candidatus Pacearchaeota archaeon]